MVLFVDSIDKFASYSSFHRNIVNVIIHVLMVPLIVFSGILIGLAFPWENETVRHIIPSQYAVPHVITTVLLIILWVFSYLLEPVAGLILNAEIVGMYYLSLYILKEYGAANALWIGIVVHITSWVAQFIGHGIFEKRRPALLSNVTQTMVAPTFVILEVLFLLGYRPQLKKDVQRAQAKHLPKKVK